MRDRELLRRVSCADRGRVPRALPQTITGASRGSYPASRATTDDVEEIINDVLLIVWERAGDFRGASRVSTLDLRHRLPLRTQLPSAGRTARSRATYTWESDRVETRVEDATRANGEPPVAGFRALEPAARATPSAHARLSHGLFVRRDCCDRRLSGQYGEVTDVPRSTQATDDHIRGCHAAGLVVRAQTRARSEDRARE